MKQVVLEEPKVLLANVTRQNGYVMKGKKGDFITARTPDNKFIWVRLTPSKTSTPVHAYNTLTEAIKDKLEKGYEVFEIK